MKAKRRRYRITPWAKLSARTKQIRVLAVSLPVLCIALIVVSVTYLNRREAEQSAATAAYASQLLQEAQQTQETPNAQITPGAQTPQPTARPILLQDVDGHPIIAKLSIEKLELELPVLGETTDALLEIAPCLFIGPSSPADDGNMVVSAHNDRAGVQFGRLDELNSGDTVTLMDKYGDIFTYEVYDIETITPDDVAALDVYEGERALSLLTCTSNGNRRLLLRCRMV